VTAAANGRFDLEEVAAAAAEEAVPVRFTYKGVDVDVPPSLEWPVSALIAAGKGDFATALPVLLGDQFDAMLEAGLKVHEMNTLFNKIGEASGVGDSGNSSGPRTRRSRTRT
jgi:hypothetical protein